MRSAFFRFMSPRNHSPRNGGHHADNIYLKEFPVASNGSTSSLLTQSNHAKGGGLFRPWNLTKPVGLAVVASLVVLGIAILLLYFLPDRGFGEVNTSNKYQHYIWSIPPVAATVGLAAILSSIDYSLKRLQPFMDLIGGDASADRTLLLDYISIPRYIVWTYALRNRHWVVACSTLATLLSTVVSPLASSLFTVHATYVNSPVPVTLAQEVGQPDGWDDLLPAYTATSTLSSLFSTNRKMPSYTTSGYVVPQIDVGGADVVNASMWGTMPCIRISANCEATTVTYKNTSASNTGNPWTAHVKGNQTGTNYGSYALPSVGTTQFNATVGSYNGQTDPALQTFIYYMFTPQKNTSTTNATAVGPPNFFLMACNPTAQIVQAETYIVANTMAVSIGSTSHAQNLSFLHGPTSHNGFYFAPSSYGPIVEQRREALMFALVSVMYQSALKFDGGLSAAYSSQGLYNLTSTIYEDYLTLFAFQNYLRPASNNQTKVTMMVNKRITVLTFTTSSALAISLCLFLIAALLLAALVGHWRAAHLIPLRTDPGSLMGSGLLLGGDVATLLDDPHASLKEIKTRLRGQRWTIANGKICAVGGLGVADPRARGGVMDDQSSLYSANPEAGGFHKIPDNDPFSPRLSP